MFKKKQKRNQNGASDEGNTSSFYLTEDSTNISYWIYTQDNQFYQREENRFFLFKSIFWSLVLSAS